jgi:hypothetical protein
MHADLSKPSRLSGDAQDVPAAVGPLLVDKPWRLCSVSRAHWSRLELVGKTPAAIRLGRRKLWRRREIEHWINSGCPPRAVWETMRASDRGLSVRGA